MESKETKIAKDKIKQLYEKLNSQLYDEEKINKIKFYDDLKIIPGNEDRLGIEEDIYIVEKEIIRQKDKVDIVQEIYLEDATRVGEILESGDIAFDEQYKELLKERLGKLYEKVKIEEDKSNINEIISSRDKEEKENKELEMTKEEMDKTEEKNRQQDKQQSNENELEEIAKTTGMKIEDLRACTKFNSEQRITDYENFNDIVPEAKEYKNIFIVASSSNTKGNSKFHFVGITKDGIAKQIESLEPTEGINTSKEVISINRDGSQVKEKQVSALFKIGNNKGFSVSIGDYGIIQAQYVRRTPENQYIGIDINTTTQKPTTKEVKEFMDDRKNPYMQNNVDMAEAQLQESNETNIRNIDDNPNNDKVLDIDKQIQFSNGEITTIRKEAMKNNMSPEEYIERCNNTEGKTMEEKIVKVNIDIEKENVDKKETEEEYEGRTPWGDAYDRMNKRN